MFPHSLPFEPFAKTNRTTLPGTNMEVENHLFVEETFSTSMLVPGSVATCTMLSEHCSISGAGGRKNRGADRATISDGEQDMAWQVPTSDMANRVWHTSSTNPGRILRSSTWLGLS